MGYFPVNQVIITRVYEPKREIVVIWHDGILGILEKRFTFEQKKEALEFAAKEFNSLAM